MKDKEELDPNEEYEHGGELFTIADFTHYCKLNHFIDDDGNGYYVDKDNKCTDVPALPSRIGNDQVHDYPYVVWYNK